MSVYLCLLNEKRSSPNDFFGPNKSRRSRRLLFFLAANQIVPNSVRTPLILKSVKQTEKTVCAIKSANHKYFFIFISVSFFDTNIIYYLNILIN